MAYKALNPVISINILNFELFNQTDAFHTIYHLRENEEKFKLTDMMEFHFIEMSKLIREWKAGKLDPWNDALARWLLMLGMVDRRHGTVYKDIYKELEEIAMKDETLKEAFRGWEDLSLTQEQRLAYEARLKRILDEEAAQREAILREEEARKIGMEKGERTGKEIGKEIGKKIGEEKGRQAEKDTIALRLLKKGMDIESISEITGLTRERIIEMKKRDENDV